MKLSPGVTVFEHTRIEGQPNIKFGTYVLIDDFVFIIADTAVKIGSHTHIGMYTSIVATAAPFGMGDCSSISSGCRIYTSTDDFSGLAFGNPTVPDKFRSIKKGPVTIDRLAFIGANSVILPNVHIGEGAVVGANSVVTKNVEPWGIYIGNKKIGERNASEILKIYDNFLLDMGYKK